MPAALFLILTCLVLAPNHLLVGDEPRLDAAGNLVPMQLRRDRIAAELGADHPRVKQLDQTIQHMQKTLPQTGSPRNAKVLDAGELIAIVQQLAERVASLEREVATLKARTPRTELLSR